MRKSTYNKLRKVSSEFSLAPMLWGVGIGGLAKLLGAHPLLAAALGIGTWWATTPKPYKDEGGSSSSTLNAPNTRNSSTKIDMPSRSVSKPRTTEESSSSSSSSSSLNSPNTRNSSTKIDMPRRSDTLK